MNLKELTKKVLLVSQQYEKNCGIIRNEDWYILKIQEELGELTQNYLSYTLRGRNRNLSQQELKINMSKELADIFGQVLLFADYHNIDLQKSMEDKWFSYLLVDADE